MEASLLDSQNRSTAEQVQSEITRREPIVSDELRAESNANSAQCINIENHAAIISQWYGVGGLAVAFITCVAVCCLQIWFKKHVQDERAEKAQALQSSLAMVEVDSAEQTAIGNSHSVMVKGNFGFSKIDVITDGEGIDASKIASEIIAVSQVTQHGTNGEESVDKYASHQ